MALRVNSDNFEEEVLQSDVPVLVDFYSDSCIPCKMLAPILSQIEQEKDGSVKIVKVNVNFDIELAEQYGVQAAPTLVYFREGKVLSQLRGAAKKAEIENLLIG